jgi:hypothetical protein
MTVGNELDCNTRRLTSYESTFKMTQATDRCEDYNFLDLKAISDAIIVNSSMRRLVDRSIFEIKIDQQGNTLYPNSKVINNIYLRKIPAILTNFRDCLEKNLGYAVKIPDLLRECYKVGFEDLDRFFTYSELPPDMVGLECSVNKLTLTVELSQYTTEYLEKLANEIIGDCYLRMLITRVYRVKIVSDPRLNECGGRTFYPSTETEKAEYRAKIPAIIKCLKEQVEKEVGHPVNITDLLQTAQKHSFKLRGGFMF